MNKLLFLLSLILTVPSFSKTVKPKTTEDFYKTSVRIYELSGNSGGTGSIFRSFKNASHILTNKHVCRLIEQGGFVQYMDNQYVITHYKKFKQHDLCLVRVKSNLGINLRVANSLIKRSSTVYVSGHPELLPHIVTKGHVTDHMDIQLVIGTKECTPGEKQDDGTACSWFGGKPVIVTLDSQVTSNLIKPGSSGSAVFNKYGEIVGVVYAGTGRGFSHGFIVPHLYVIYFIQNAHRFNWVKVGTPVDDEGISDRIFNYEKCRSPKLKLDPKYKKIKDFCKNIKDNVLYIRD